MCTVSCSLLYMETARSVLGPEGDFLAACSVPLCEEEAQYGLSLALLLTEGNRRSSSGLCSKGSEESLGLCPSDKRMWQLSQFFYNKQD